MGRCLPSGSGHWQDHPLRYRNVASTGARERTSHCPRAMQESRVGRENGRNVQGAWQISSRNHGEATLNFITFERFFSGCGIFWCLSNKEESRHSSEQLSSYRSRHTGASARFGSVGRPEI